MSSNILTTESRFVYSAVTMITPPTVESIENALSEYHESDNQKSYEKMADILSHILDCHYANADRLKVDEAMTLLADFVSRDPEIDGGGSSDFCYYCGNTYSTSTTSQITHKSDCTWVLGGLMLKRHIAESMP